jgi:hypothetical protein
MFGRRRFCALAATMLLALAWSSLAMAQDWQEDGGGRDRGFSGWHNPSPQWERELAQATGFLIVNGKDVPLPCQIVLDGDRLMVNDVVVTSHLGGVQPGSATQEMSQGKSRFSSQHARFVAIGLGQAIVQGLAGGHLVVALADQPLVILSDSKAQEDTLRALVKPDQTRITRASLAKWLPPGIDASTFSAWMTSFIPSEDFRQRALARIQLYEQTEAAAQAEVAATRRLNTFSYPLSILGMVATTLGIGHLLTHRPPVDVKPLEKDASPLALRVLSYSLVLVILFSAIDLTWTILAYQAGEMLELNPLGSRLIDDPLSLLAFKGGATGMGVGLLYSLRRYRKAQLAAWWVCLICTLVTARWLTVSHMFAA